MVANFAMVCLWLAILLEWWLGLFGFVSLFLVGLLLVCVDFWVLLLCSCFCF